MFTPFQRQVVQRQVDKLIKNYRGKGMSFKVLGGTPKSGKSLCLSCGNMARRIGQDLQEEIFCSAYAFENPIIGSGNRVPFRVSECTEYQPFNQQGIKEMKEIAWIIQARKKGPSGFSEGVTSNNEETETIIEILPPKEKKYDYDE